MSESISLPRRIEKIGDVRPEELRTPGLLYLPNPYIVPGGRFNEMYGWDSYFILLGLEADHREALAKGIVDNFLFEIEHYGGGSERQPHLLPHSLAAAVSHLHDSRGLRRSSQLSGHLRRVARRRAHGSSTPTRSRRRTTPPGSVPSTRRAQPAWPATSTMEPARCPEMADDSTYYVDVIRWLVAHPHQGGDGYLVKASEHPDAAEAARLKLTSCDVHASVVCARAWFGGYRLSREFYAGDRAMRESGFDSSNRFGPFSGDTTHYAPVCLNSLLYRYERDLEHLALLLGNVRDAAHWDRRSQQRAAAIQRYLWRPEGWRLRRLRLCPRADVELCLYHFALSPVGRLRHARTSHKDGSEAQPFRASRRLIHKQHQHRPAVGRAVRLGAHQLDRCRTA